MAAAFAELLVIFIGNQRTVYIDRHLPAKSFIQPVVFRRGGKILVSPHHMSDSHQMIVHHIGKIVGGITVGLDQDHIVQFPVVHRNISVYLVMEGGLPLSGVILSDHVREPGL